MATPSWEVRTCNYCHQDLPVYMFHIRANRCKECHEKTRKLTEREIISKNESLKAISYNHRFPRK